MYIYIHIHSPCSFRIHSLPIQWVFFQRCLAFHHLSHDARPALQKNEASPGEGAGKQQEAAHGGSQHVVDLPGGAPTIAT